VATAAAAMMRWSRCHHAAALAGKAARQQRSLAVREVKIVAGSGAPACCAVGIPWRDELFQLALESGGAGAGVRLRLVRASARRSCGAGARVAWRTIFASSSGLSIYGSRQTGAPEPGCDPSRRVHCPCSRLGAK
jgi:hypothetical protein